MVFAFAGDSTTTNDFAIPGTCLAETRNGARKPLAEPKRILARRPEALRYQTAGKAASRLCDQSGQFELHQSRQEPCTCNTGQFHELIEPVDLPGFHLCQ